MNKKNESGGANQPITGKRRLLTIAETALVLERTPQTIARAIGRGKISVVAGGRVMVDPDEIATRFDIRAQFDDPDAPSYVPPRMRTTRKSKGKPATVAKPAGARRKPAEAVADALRAAALLLHETGTTDSFALTPMQIRRASTHPVEPPTFAGKRVSKETLAVLARITGDFALPSRQSVLRSVLPDALLALVADFERLRAFPDADEQRTAQATTMLLEPS